MSDPGIDSVKHAPGSPAGVAQSCTCSTTLNRDGQDTLHGQPRFYYDRKCPVHKVEVAKLAKEAGGIVPRF